MAYFEPITIFAGFSFTVVIVFIKYGMSLKLDVSSKENTEHKASTLSLHACEGIYYLCMFTSFVSLRNQLQINLCKCLNTRTGRM